MPVSERRNHFFSMVCRGAALFAIPAVALAVQAIAPFDCVQGVCGFNALSPELRIAPCSNRSILVAYSHDSGATLIQCSSTANTSENVSYVFDRFVSNGRQFELSGTRFIKQDYLGEAVDTGIPDRFGSVPLCSPAAAKTVRPDEIVVVRKAPGEGTYGYCYRILRILGGPNGVSVEPEGGALTRASAAMRAEWLPLSERILAFLPGTLTARVVAPKAPLFRDPDPTAGTKMYLVKGDTARVLDETRVHAGWIKVRYVTRTGRAIDMWVHASDLTLTEGAGKGPKGLR